MEDLVREHVGPVVGKVPGVVVAVLADGEEHVVALGDLTGRPEPRHDCWEIASITKGFTGMLLAEMSLRGEVRLDDPIGAHLPDDVAARLPPRGRQPTLEDLATHRGGFSSIPPALLRRARGDDPYAQLDEAMVFDVLGRRTRRSRLDRLRYSNFGMGLLGHILGHVAGQPYDEILRSRILEPLDLHRTGVGTCGDGSEVVPGVRKGEPTPAWTFGALAACGALRSTPADLLAFARITLDPPSGAVGDAMQLAMTPRRKGSAPDMRIGLGWMTRTFAHGDVVWHNGGTYGASSFLAVDRTRRTAVVALGNTGPRLLPRLDAPGWALLDAIAASGSR